MNSQIMIMSETSETDKESSEIQLDINQIAVFIHLHYIDTLERYFSYIDIIPNNIPVYFTTSNLEVKRRLLNYVAARSRKKVEIILKENRGRDITSFLVALRTKMLEYKYICFLHDKKEKSAIQKEDVELWIHNLWGNLLGTHNASYFWKIISLFEKDKRLGLLAPPEPMGESIGYNNAWREPYISLTKRLAKDLDISVEIESDINKQPLTLGTCFWARKEALVKLLLRNWKYEDFDDEPIPDDGICYAVERILGYVVEDVGYSVYNIMSNEYAEKYMCFLMESRRRAFKELDKRYTISTLYELKKLDEVCNYFDNHKATYLYGAGKVGKRLCTYLCDNNRYPKGFIVSNKASEKHYLNLPVRGINEVYIEWDTGIIVSVEGGKVAEIEDELRRRGFNDYICLTR